MGAIRIYQVDAFADRAFSGNPAAICPLAEWLPGEVMQSIAAENNLSETAFFVPGGEGGYDLRWFTPTVEVELCGHATLASAHVLLRELGADGPVRFQSASGPLTVHAEGGRLRMDFPSNPPVAGAMPVGLAEALGIAESPGPVFAASGKVAVVVLASEAEVVALRPDFGALGRVALPGGLMGVAATAPGADPAVDFVSRFFAPWVGVDEDPVTGVAHTTLTPYWAARLGRSEMSARQRSARGGSLTVRDRGARVELFGQAVTVAAGRIRAV